MIKNPIAKGQIEIVIGDRYAVEGDPHKFEAHIYLDKGANMYGGVGNTAAEALFNAVSHWRERDDRATTPTSA